MTAPIANSYDPEQVEKSWYSWWESQGFFKPSEDPAIEKYIIPIPPPNEDIYSKSQKLKATNARVNQLIEFHSECRTDLIF